MKVWPLGFGHQRHILIMFIYTNSFVCDNAIIIVEVNRFFRSVKINVNGCTRKKVVCCSYKVKVNNIEVDVKAFPLWSINIYKNNELVRENFLPIRKSKAYWYGVSVLPLSKLLLSLYS